MTKPAVTSGGLPGTSGTTSPDTVPGTADYIETAHARSLGLRYRLHHRPRHAKALDRLLYGAPDPWTYAQPVGDYYRDSGLDRLRYRSAP